MAVSTLKGVTTLTPTGWKWFASAAFVSLVWPGLGMLVGFFLVLMGAGVLQRVALSKEGVKVRNWWSTKAYAWRDIDDFRVYKVRSGLINAASMVSFTHVNKQGTAMGKAAKFLTGGTHSIPAVGMPAKKLAQLMQAYKLGFVPEDAVEPELKPAPPVPAIPAQRAAQPAPKPQVKPRPRAVPATPRAQKKRAEKQLNLGGSRKGSGSLVQDGGGLFGRRRPDSPFGS